MSAPFRPGGLLAAAVLVVPLAALWGRGGAAPGVLLGWHALVLLAVVLRLAAGRRAADSGGYRPPGVPLAAWSAFLAVALVGATLAPYRYAAFLGMLELAAFTALVWLAAERGPALLAPLSGWLLAAAAAEGSLTLWQRWVQGSERPAGTLENPNHLAAWLVAALLAGLTPLLGALPGRAAIRSSRALLLAAAAAVPAGIALALTGSRGGLLGLAAGGGWLALRYRRRLPLPARIGAVALLLALAIPLGLSLWQRQHEADPFRYQRFRIWRASLGAVLEAPWTGTGPRQFAVAAENLNFPDGDGPLRYDRSFSRPHSDLLRVVCETGWPGALLLLLALVLTARGVRAAGSQGPDGDPQQGILRDGALAALLALAAQGLVENLSERPAITTLAAVWIGCLIAVPRRTTTVPARPRALRAALACLAVWIFLVGDAGPYLAWRALDRLPRGRLASGDLERLERAAAWNPLHPDPWLRRAEHLAGDGSDWDLVRYAAAREAAERAVRLQPRDARYRSGLAGLEALACRTLFRDVDSRRRAAAHYREAEARARTNPFLPLERSKLLLDTGDPAGARRAAERALSIEPNAVPPRLLLAEALLVLGGPESRSRAAELLEQARRTAERFAAHRDEGPYAARLLALNAAAVSRIEARIAPGAAPPESPVAPRSEGALGARP